MDCEINDLWIWETLLEHLITFLVALLTKTIIFSDEFIMKLKHQLNHNRIFLTFPRVSLLTMNRFNLKINSGLLQENQSDGNNPIYCQWYFMALGITESTIFKQLISKGTRKAPRNICKISILNKAV